MFGSNNTPATIGTSKASRPKLASTLAQAWRPALILVLTGAPFVIDPGGLLPFTVPKQAWLLSGATALLAAWFAAQARQPCGLKAQAFASPAAETPIGQASTSAQRLALLLCAYVAWSVAAPLLATPNVLLHLANAVRLPALLVIFCLSALLGSDAGANWPRRAILGFAIAGSILTVHVLLEAWGIEPLRLLAPVADAGGRWRTFATIGNPAWSAEFLAAVYPLTQFSLNQFLQPCREKAPPAARKLLDFAPMPAWVAFCAAIMVTGSRLGMLAFIAASIATAHIRRQSRAFGWESSRLKYLLCYFSKRALLAAFMAIGAYLLSLPFIASWPERLLDSGSIAGRYALLHAGLAMITASPLFGHGAGSLALIAPEFRRRLLPTLPPDLLSSLSHDLADHVHNDLMQTAIDSGIPSAILLALIWLAALQLAFRSVPTLADHQFLRAIGASLVAVLISSFGSAPLYTMPTAALFWALLGLLAGASQARSVCPEPGKPSKWRMCLAVAACCVCAATIWWQLRIVTANRLAYRAEAYVAHGRYEDAEEDYKQVAMLWPWNHETRVKAAAVLAQNGKLEAALAAVEASARWGASPEMWLLQAELLLALGKDAEAETTLLEAIEVFPDLMRARMALARLLRQAGKREAALQQYRMVIASRQQSPLAMRLKKQAIDSLAAMAQETMYKAE